MKAIEKICKKSRIVQVCNLPDGDQWIGTGHAVYRVHGMPTLTEENIRNIFGVDKDTWQEKWYFKENCGEELPLYFDNMNDEDRVDIPLKWLDVSVIWQGEEYYFARYGGRIIIVKALQVDCAMRNTKDGEWWIRKIDQIVVVVLKLGMFVEAVICPVTDNAPHILGAIKEIFSGEDGVK